MELYAYFVPGNYRSSSYSMLLTVLTETF